MSGSDSEEFNKKKIYIKTFVRNIDRIGLMNEIDKNEKSIRKKNKINKIQHENH